MQHFIPVPRSSFFKFVKKKNEHSDINQSRFTFFYFRIQLNGAFIAHLPLYPIKSLSFGTQRKVNCL